LIRPQGKRVTWWYKEVGDGVASFGPTFEIQKTLRKYHADLARNGELAAQDGIALFSRFESQRNVVTLYFTPEAKFLAESLGFTLCERPSVDGLSLAYGRKAIWDSHFDGKRPPNLVVDQ
jgi:hypothetical protein